MINKGALAKYSQGDIMRGALPRVLRVKAVMTLELDLRDPATSKHSRTQTPVVDRCVTTDAITLLDPDRATTAPGVSSYSIAAWVPLSLISVELNLPAISNQETPAPAEATKAIDIAKAENSSDFKMYNTMQAFEAWTFQMSKVNEPRYGDYQTTKLYSIQAEHPLLYSPINFPPLN